MAAYRCILKPPFLGLMLEKYQQGMYALSVSGRLPEDAIDRLESMGFHYQPRDSSVRD
jgi:hypothetical protein